MENQIILQGVSIDQLAAAVADRLSGIISPPTMEGQEILNVDQAAVLLGLSVPSIWRLKATEGLPYRKIGNGRVVFLRDELLTWIKDRK